MSSSPGFPGFPEGRLPTTPVPNLFLSQVLPTIDHLGELKVTLYAFWSLAHKEGRFRYLRRDEIAADRLLMQGLGRPGLPADQALDEALERAVARGTLLRVSASDGQAYYFINSARGRAAVEAVAQGRWSPSGESDSPIELSQDRPTVYTLYEQNIGPLTPMIAERLTDAAASYPPGWIEDAVRIAVENNVRKWSYVQAILEDWRSRGRDEREDRGDSQKALRRYTQGESADFFDS